MNNKTFQTVIISKPGSKRPTFLLARRGLAPDTLFVVATFNSEGSCKAAMNALNKEPTS